MLSQETAIGAYPVESVEMMAAVAEGAPSASSPTSKWSDERVRRDARGPRVHDRPQRLAWRRATCIWRPSWCRPCRVARRV